MGWLWATPSPPGTPAPGRDKSAEASSKPPAPSSDTEMDPEVAKFLALFQTDTGSKSSEKKPEPASTPAKTSTPAPATKSSLTGWLPSLHASSSQTNQRSYEQPHEPAPLLDPIGEATLPTEMSCRQAFDMAWHCQSVGGQWISIYRYGSMQPCSELWDDFWFCMRTKSYTGQMKEDAIREHYRKKQHNKYGNGQPNSYDVWEPRRVMMARGSSFSAPFPEFAGTDEEWRRDQVAKRKALREILAAGEGGEVATGQT